MRSPRLIYGSKSSPMDLMGLLEFKARIEVLC